MTVRVTVDASAVRKFINTDPVAQARLQSVAEAFRTVAERFSPVGSPRNSKMPGYFKRRWYVRRFRSVYYVGNRDAFYHLIEYGSVNNPTYAPTRRAMLRIASNNAGVKAVFIPKGTDAADG